MAVYSIWAYLPGISELIKYRNNTKSPGKTRVNSGQLLRFQPQFLMDDIGDFTFGAGSFGHCSPEVLNREQGVTLKIGKFCSFARGTTIMLGNADHRSDFVTTYPFNILFKEFSKIPRFSSSKGDVVIGNDVWVARGALIMSGVSIADGAIIGANSVVTHNVEPYTIVAGNPAKPIRKRFDTKTIDALLKIRWWNWSIQRIQENVPLLLSDRIELFIKKNLPDA